MRVSVNLATHPFVELRPILARLRIAMAFLALLAVGLGIALHISSRRVSAAEARMQDLRNQTAALVDERTANEQRMRQPQNLAILDRSRFLNEVFARKSFSWTAVMMDLENVLPAGVQVSSIEPIITPDGDVNIRLRVSGERDREVELVRNLERSQRFISPRPVTESAHSQDQNRPVSPGLPPGAVEFEILSGYNPLPAQKAAIQKDKTASSHAAAKTSSSAPPSKKPAPAGGAR